jgi:hypothetical protein
MRKAGMTRRGGRAKTNRGREETDILKAVFSQPLQARTARYQNYCNSLHTTAVRYNVLCAALQHCRAALFSSRLHCTTLRCIAQHCRALHCIALLCIALYCVALLFSELRCIALCSATLHCVTLNRITLCCITLLLFVLLYTVLHR